MVTTQLPKSQTETAAHIHSRQGVDRSQRMLRSPLGEGVGNGRNAGNKVSAMHLKLHELHGSKVRALYFIVYGEGARAMRTTGPNNQTKLQVERPAANQLGTFSGNGDTILEKKWFRAYIH